MATATLRGTRDLQLNLFEVFTNECKTGSQGAEVRNKRSEVGSRRSEVKGQESGVGSQKNQELPANPTSTSQSAAASSRHHAQSDELRIYHFLRLTRAGATNDQISERLQIPLQTVCPRVNALVRAGKVRDSGRKSPTRSGRSAIVWEAV